VFRFLVHRLDLVAAVLPVAALAAEVGQLLLVQLQRLLLAVLVVLELRSIHLLAVVRYSKAAAEEVAVLLVVLAEVALVVQAVGTTPTVLLLRRIQQVVVVVQEQQWVPLRTVVQAVQELFM
jgi:hypothetical protein